MNDGVFVTTVTHHNGWIYSDQSMIEIKKLNDYLIELRKDAVKLLHDEDADHVVYAHKQYKDDVLDRVDFYMIPLTEEQFAERTKTLDGVVYAVHKRI